MKIKRRHKKKSISFFSLICIFVITLLSFSVGYSLLSQELSISGTASIAGEIIQKKEFRTDDFLLTYQINSWYNNGKTYYQYNFTLENIGVNDFSEWYLKIYLPPDTEKVGEWEARYTLNMGELLVQNIENRTLTSGTSTLFGYQFSTTDDAFELKKVDMNGTIIILGESGDTGGDTGNTGGDSGDTGGDSGDTGGDLGDTGGDTGDTGGDSGNTGGSIMTGALEVSSKKITSWGSSPQYYHQYSFTVNNVSDQDLTEWTFDVVVGEGVTIHQNWGCNYIDKEGTITLSNSDYNSNLKSGNSLEVVIVFISSHSEIDVVFE